MQIESKAVFQRDYLHTRLITLSRGLAALEVFVGHMRNQFFPDYKLVAHPSLLFKALICVTGYGPQAVILFFVMSGWLVGGNLLNRMHEENSFRLYLIDRVTRLWVVMIPTMICSLIIGLILYAKLGPNSLIDMRDLRFSVFLGNLAGLSNTEYANDYGGNLALWSLANETWYYVAFPLLVIPFLTGWRVWSKILSVAGLIAIGVLLPWRLVQYSIIWLLGVVFSRLRLDFKSWQIGVNLAVLALASLIIRWHRWDAHIGPDFTLALLYAIFLAGTKFRVSPSVRWRRPEKVANLVSDMSFSLYTMHVPVMLLLVGVFGLESKTLDQAAPLSWAIYATFVAIVFGAAYLFYRAFESKTYAVRSFLKARLIR